MIIDIRTPISATETIVIHDFSELYTLLKRLHLLANVTGLVWRFKNSTVYHKLGIGDI